MALLAVICLGSRSLAPVLQDLQGNSANLCSIRAKLVRVKVTESALKWTVKLSVNAPSASTETGANSNRIIAHQIHARVEPVSVPSTVTFASVLQGCSENAVTCCPAIINHVLKTKSVEICRICLLIHPVLLVTVQPDIVARVAMRWTTHAIENRVEIMEFASQLYYPADQNLIPNCMTSLSVNVLCTCTAIDVITW